MCYVPIRVAGHSYAPADHSIPSSSRGNLFLTILFILAGCLTGSLAWSQQWTTAPNLLDIYNSNSGKVGIGWKHC